MTALADFLASCYSVLFFALMAVMTALWIERNPR